MRGCLLLATVSLVLGFSAGCEPIVSPPADAGSDGGSTACGPTTCAAGTVCCNASCGICTPPGNGCIQIACVPDVTDPCATVRCKAGTHCDAGACVADPTKVFCGGFAGIQCPDGSACVDDPSDGCDPNAGGADCGGMCVCVQNALCIQGS